MTFQRRYTALTSDPGTGVEMEIFPVIPLEPGDILMVSRTGERTKVCEVDGDRLKVERGFGPFQVLPARRGDELMLVGSVFSA